MSSSFSNNHRRFVLIALVTVLVILIGSPKYGEAWRPLLQDGFMQMLPKGPPNPSNGGGTNAHHG
ncbi:uncharacterized protein DS421_2g45970 [Arachis hypogaea]|nr:uncharacterized protein DS421_2g45970 [Arachis hypogaea]